MTWENELSQFYERLKPKPIFCTKADIEIVFDEVVVPALESIESRLNVYAKNVKIKKYVCRATISFEDQVARRSVFGVRIDLKYQTISFPYTINSTSTFTSGIALISRDEITKDFIISNFMTFFMSREENIKRIDMRSEEESD